MEKEVFKMKRFLAMILACVMLLMLLPLSASAAASGTLGDTITWSFTDDGTLTISGTGAMPDYDSSSFREAPWYPYAKKVTKIVINGGITRVGDYTFYNLNGSYYPNVTSVELKGVKEIGTKTFFNSTLMTDLTLGEGLQTIGNNAFAYCDGLSTVKLPDSLTLIGQQAFYECDYMETVSIPEHAALGALAFASCDVLTAVYIPETVVSIEPTAFFYCDALTIYGKTESAAEIHCLLKNIPFSATGAATELWPYSSGTDGNITWTFYCDRTLRITGTGAMPDYTMETYTTVPWGTFVKYIRRVEIGEDITYIGEYTFNNPSALYRDLTSVEIFGNTTVGASAFRYCNMTEVVMSGETGTIGTNAFYNCDLLTDFVFPEGLQEIGPFAFHACSSLTTVVVPDGTQSIGENAFWDCTGLTDIYIPASVTFIGKDAFRRCTCTVHGDTNSWTYMYCLLNNLPFESTGTQDPAAVYDTGTTGDVTWTFYADGTLVIEGEGAMADYTGKDAPWYPYRSQILSLQIGDGVSDVGTLAFAGCNQITEVWFEGDAPEIASDAFTNVTANAYYHYVKDGWTEDVLLNYGGKLTWESMECIHAYETAVTEPTCLDGGYTTYTCTKCGDTYTADETEPLGHDYVGTVTEPTCTEKGYTTYTCSRCEDTYTADETDALGHTEVTDEAVAPTCTETGLTEGSHCAVCGEILVPQEIVPTADHDYIEDLTAPTCTADGSVTYTCSCCGDTYTEVLPAVECPTKDYKDVPNTANWGHAGIDFCVDRGIMGSTTTDDLIFEPGTVCTRAMIVSILYRLTGSPEVEYEAVFPDVPDGQWYSDAVIWGYQNGVVKGYDTGKFGPNDKITREQMAVILKGYTENVVGMDTSETTSLASFYDANKATWSKPYVEWAVAVGMISGKIQSDGKTMLDPQGNATRAEVASILMRYIQNILE